MLLVTSPGAGWCCQADVILFTAYVFSYLVSQCKYSLVKLLVESLCFPLNPL